MKIKNKIILVLLLSTSFSIADSTVFFDDNAINNPSSRTMIGSDELNETDIDVGIRYRVNMGTRTDTVTEDESGNIQITDDTNHTTTGKLSEFNHAPYQTAEFNNTKKASINYFLEHAADTKKRIDLNSTESEIIDNWNDLQNQELEKAEIQKKQNKYIRDNGGSLQNNKEVFIKARSPFRGGNSAISAFTQDNITKFDVEKLKEQELNATLYYKDTVGLKPGYNPKQNLIQRNIGGLSDAYANIDDITKKLTEKLNGSKISCQITRNLIPQFFCPLTGKQGLRFPGTAPNGDVLNNINQDDELKKCNDFCRTDIWVDSTETNISTTATEETLHGEIPCVKEDVFSISDLNSTINKNLEMYPNFNSNSMEIILNTNGISPIGKVVLTFVILNPEQGLSEEEQEKSDKKWNKFLKENGLKMRMATAIDQEWNKKDNIRDDTDTRIIKTYISQNRIIYLNSTEIKVTFGFQEKLSNKYFIEFKKPFFKFELAKKYFENSGAKVVLKDVYYEYMSNAYHYCTGTQFVGNPLDCNGPTKVININGSPQYLCKDETHKVGPVPDGGYYSNNNCVRACVQHRNCYATYSGYSNNFDNDGNPSAAIIQSRVECVDSPTVSNGACTTQLCKEFFKDDIFPINEILVAKDNTNIYTVKDGALTDYPRPKVDYEREIENPNLEVAWQEEEKDAAYKTMIRELTYNRIKYRIGEISPANVAVKVERSSFGETQIVGYLKPKSDDFKKTAYIYAVLRLEHWYTPIAGTWQIDGQQVSVGVGDTDRDIRLKDVTYVIKDSNNVDSWKVFRRVEEKETLVDRNIQRTNADGSIDMVTRKVWVKVPAYTSDKFGYYNSSNDTFGILDQYTQKAINFTTTEFNVNQNFFVYNIVTNLEESLKNIPGGFIRNQVSINNSTDFLKTYNNPEIDNHYGSHISTYYIYLTYSTTQLTYDQLMKLIEGNDYTNNPVTGYESQFGLIDMINPVKYKTEIEHDGEIDNNIKPILKGSPSSQTVSVEWKPRYDEKGKKAYKFIFLYNDQEETDWSFDSN